MKNLVIPENLYGREKEIATISESFERISKGVGEILIVPGTSGVGKTALVQKLETPVKSENGFFVSGKFEQFQQNIPYFAFRQALTTLCHIILAEDEPIRERYKTEILDAVGSQGRVLIDLANEFESLLGKQPQLEKISPQEARHRFADVLRKFLSVICKPEHPLVFFIDDWQWADTASFELLKQLEVGKTLRYILVILSYRDNEVNSSHQLTATLDELKRNNVILNRLKVSNLTQSDVQNILEDTLLPAADDTAKLAAIIHKKTLGNPFFVHAAIHYLSDFKLLWFNVSENRWKWKIDLENEFPDNVVDLFVRKFQRLDRHAQKLYSLAACLGNRFNIKNLEIISDFSLEECKSILNSPDGKEFAIPLKLIQKGAISRDDSETDVYIFRHDRLQQAAFQLIAEEHHSKILFKIGKLLLAKLSPEQLNERFFEVVNDLNAGIDQIDNSDEREELFRLNIQAARKAYAAIAYSAALQFYRKAEKILEKEGFSERMWEHHHELLMSYLTERAVCEFLEGDQKSAEQFVHQAVKNADNAVEKAEAYNILIVQYTLQARYPEAIASGKSALEALGIILPEKDYDKSRDKEIAKVKEQLKNKEILSLSQLPNMNNPEMLTACKILITMGPPCYRSHQKLWSVMVPIVVGLTLKYGNIPQVGYSHTAFGGLLGWVEDDYASANKFADVATQLMTEKFSIPSDQSVFYLMIGSSIRHWFKHLKYSSQDYIDAYEIGLRSGNLQYAAYAFGHNMYCRFYQGISLETLNLETQRSLEFSKTRHNQWAIDLFTGGLKIIDVLTAKDYRHSVEKIANDGDYIKSVDAHKNIQVKCIYKVLKTFSLLILGNYKDALIVSDETEPIIYTAGTQGLLPWPEHVFARILVCGRLYSEKEGPEQKKWLKEIKKGINKLRIWANYCPENFEHKYLLATAELNIIEGNSAKALQNYKKAADTAQENEFLQWEGFANERMHDFWFEQKNYHLAFHYWKQAYVCYQHWGATAKLKQMENHYVDYLNKSISAINLVKTKGVEKDKFSKWLIENQLIQIRNLASHMYQSRLSQQAMNHAEELASATKRLRNEISYRKQAEEEVKSKNFDLEKINAEKDKFFTIIAHDLKSPFNSIQGFSELLVENASEKNFESIEEYAALIHKSSKRAMDLLSNLMEWAQSQTGRMIFAPKVFNLADLIDEIVLMLESSAVQKKVQIKKVTPPETIVYADKAMVSTILRNLISNSIKFSYPGGEISVSVTKNNNELVVAVSDSGIGIPKEIIGKLFQVNQNMTTPGTQNEQGTGLGLILCKEFIEKHGGKISVESEPGKGSKFYFNIPDHAVQSEKTAINPKVVSEENQINKLKILIAEDDEVSEMLISIMVGKFSREIITARTGPEAVEACRNNTDIDLVLMDIQMPGLNGYEATRQIRQFNNKVIIIAQTAYGLSGDREIAIDAGCNDYTTKPVKKEELRNLINKYFDLIKYIIPIIFLIISGSCGKPTREPDIASLEKYHTQLSALRTEYREYQLPEASFFLFGMGNREKLLYKNGSLISVQNQKTLYQWNVKEEIIIPNDYTVFLSTTDNKRVFIFENEKGVFIKTDGKIEALSKGNPLVLSNFEGHPSSEVLKVLNHEILINIDNGLPLPNFFVYNKPWRRDAAMMAMCLENTGNLNLIKNWVLALDEVYDFNNKSDGGPEYEVDNLGQTLYLISLFADASHPLVPKILEEAKRWERIHEGKLYLHGRTDFSEMPVYQTKWMKYGLKSLGLPDPYEIPDIDCQYSSLFWWDYKEIHKPVEEWRNDYYPYIGWARDHFYGLKQSPISAVDYPLTWEIEASQANYEGIRLVSDNYANAKCAAPHTWHTAEVFLYLISSN